MEAYQIEATEGYNLFRRAIMERDEDAWAESIARYRPLLIAWARRRSAKIPTAERCDDIADHALARAWAALSPAHFSSFPNLAALLGYLRACVSATLIDLVRAEYAQRRAMQRLAVDMVAPTEQIVLEKLEREELWRIVWRQAVTTQEQIILTESFVFQLSPRAIQARHSALFTDAATIYTIKRNLLDRLRHDAGLRRFYRGYADHADATLAEGRPRPEAVVVS